MNPTETAMHTYHTRYNNTTYQAAQAAIIADLYGKHMVTQTHLIDRHAAYEPAHGLLNIMTDVALELCGHPDMTGRTDTLTRLILTHKLSADTITTIAAHLANFYKPTAEDWQHRALALHTLQAIDLHPAIQPTERVTESYQSAWQMMDYQLERQFDRATYGNYLKPMTLVDVQLTDKNRYQITVTLPNERQCDMILHRLSRNIRRVWSDASGQPMEQVDLIAVTETAWRERTKQ